MTGAGGVRALRRLRTGRMLGEPLGPEHEDEIARLALDPRVYRTLWPWSFPPTIADVRSSLARQRDHWERHGFGLWLLRDRDSGELVGRGGLLYTDVLGGHAVEVAWAVVPERWGEGLATELARGAVALAFGTLDLEEVIAITLPDNVASRRVMEKSGFRYEGEVEHAGLEHVLYRRRQTEPTRGEETLELADG
ncbi:MAG: GNAT family N-acetyltransferase [Solirubrobacteraceae bacterium]